MTSTQDPGTFQNMIDWLEGELRQVKSQMGEYADQAEQARTQLWDLADQHQRHDAGVTTVTAQLKVLTNLPEEVRLVRERIERLQSVLGQDQEQKEQLARQLRAEMQAERDKLVQMSDELLAQVGATIRGQPRTPRPESVPGR